MVQQSTRFAASGLAADRCRGRVFGIAVGLAASAGGCFFSSTAAAQGHEAVVIANPSRADSLYVANVYADARHLPEPNVLFFDPRAESFAALAAVNHPAFLGELDRRRIAASADYILLTPDAPFFVSAPGLIIDPCSPLTRFSLSSAYGLAPIADQLLDGTISQVTTPNGFASTTLPSPAPFDSQTGYVGGNQNSSGRRTFIAAHLGYTGPLGNSLEQVLATFDRGVASDGAFPSAPVQLIETTDAARSGPRDGLFPAVTSFINGFGFLNGATAQTFLGTLPEGGVEVAGVMTGLATPAIGSADFSLVPGAYADHLTSFAATFDVSIQTKMSSWIAKGATLTSGAVEEPCNYPGKFPSARLFQFAVQGSTLGEAYYRSLSFVPFQAMLMGDPLARPWGAEGSVVVPDLSQSPQSGVVSFTPSAQPGTPFIIAESFDAYVNGVLRASVTAGTPIEIDTRALGDGVHELRVVATEQSAAEIQTTATQLFEVDNFNGGVSLSSDIASGSLGDVFTLSVDASTDRGGVEQVRVLHRGRVVASANAVPADIGLHGQLVGAGPVTLVAEIQYLDARTARSAPLEIDITYDPNAPSDGAPPTAFGYELVVDPATESFVVALPADHSDGVDEPVYRVVGEPTDAVILAGDGIDTDGPYRVLQREPGEASPESVVFEIEDSQGRTSQATVRLVYRSPDTACIADQNGDDMLSGDDFNAWVSNFLGANPSIADTNSDGTLDSSDFNAWLTAFLQGCG
ncbi:MAG: GC-type dockerin domain-anchored protein [Planctomycetota bacterium]